MLNTTKNILWISLLLLSLTACQEDEFLAPFESESPTTYSTLNQFPNIPNTPFNYANPDLPNHLLIPPVQNADNTPTANPVTDWGATLGRVLFYDKHLSANNQVSCASCHTQADGFSDSKVFSEGFEGGLTGRHSMSLANARYYPNGSFFWDERAATLEDQTLMPIQDHIEMGMELDTLVEKLQFVPYYPQLFRNAYGTNEITTDRISMALAQFVRSIVSYQTKYDEGRAQLQPGQNPGATPFPNYTAQENLGKAIFFGPNLGACAGCHGGETFTAPGARNNGLDLVYEDNGVFDVTGLPQDRGDFKVPSLKNVVFTAPYMHDGRFATLEEVIDHYDTGVQPHPALSPPLRLPNGQPRRLNLTQAEKDALVAFLHTLTDESLLEDVKFSDPFN
jgi:cytochrome c peroxidase